MQKKTVLRVDGLEIRRDGPARSDLLVGPISFAVRQGETLGIVGESGSGKSLTAKSILGLLPAGLRRSGRMELLGADASAWTDDDWRRVRGDGVCMVMQDPFTMLNPLHRCGRHITESLPAGDRAARQATMQGLLEEVGIDDPSVAYQYPFQLSGGMRQRVGIAAALARQPALLVADEPTTALDTTTQKDVLTLIRTAQLARNMGMIFITHDLRLAFSICDRILVLYAGAVMEEGPADMVRDHPAHPYTWSLLQAEPSVRHRATRLFEIPGSVPHAQDVQHMCRFAPRCPWATEACRAAAPPTEWAGDGRTVSCIRAGELHDELARRSVDVVADVDGGDASVSEILRISGATKTFSSARRRVAALDGVSLTIHAGECVGLVGESGSGKSTLGRCVVGLESLDSGDIRIGGRTVDRLQRRWHRSRRETSSVQIVFQDPYSSLNPARTIGSTLAEALARAATGAGAPDVGDLLKTVGLPRDYARRLPSALSGGERQRVAIARALAVRPELIVCDEAVSALDVSVQAQVLNLLLDLRKERGLSYLFITHDLSVVRQLADRVYVMKSGKIVESGDTATVLDRSTNPYTAKLLDAIPV